MTTGVEIVVSPDPGALAREGAARFVTAAQQAIAARDRFVVALSGGSTPKTLLGLLAGPPYRDRIDWSRVVVCWGDERCVPPDSDQSNYRLAREALLDQVPIPPEQIHRIPAENPDHAAAARAYAATLRQIFDLTPGDWPRFDLIHLGLGPEGHTASLFPGSPVLQDRAHLVAAPFVEQHDTYRITLTPPVINAAREVVFLVAGESKAAIVAAVLRGPRQPEQLPAQIVAPVDGRLVWLLDAAAASHLDRGGDRGD